MEFKKVLPLSIFLAVSPLFAETSTQKMFETNQILIHLSTQETSTLSKLNALNTKNKNIVLIMLDSLYEKKLEKKNISENQKDSEN